MGVDSTATVDHQEEHRKRLLCAKILGNGLGVSMMKWEVIADRPDVKRLPVYGGWLVLVTDRMHQYSYMVVDDEHRWMLPYECTTDYMREKYARFIERKEVEND